MFALEIDRKAGRANAIANDVGNAGDERPMVTQLKLRKAVEEAGERGRIGSNTLLEPLCLADRALQAVGQIHRRQAGLIEVFLEFAVMMNVQCAEAA
jgi:hypothetical protein